MRRAPKENVCIIFLPRSGKVSERFASGRKRYPGSGFFDAIQEFVAEHGELGTVVNDRPADSPAVAARGGGAGNFQHLADLFRRHVFRLEGPVGAPTAHENLHALRRGKVALQRKACFRVAAKDGNSPVRADGKAVLAAIAEVGILQDHLHRPFGGKGQYLRGAIGHAASAAVAQFRGDGKSKIRERFHGTVDWEMGFLLANARNAEIVVPTRLSEVIKTPAHFQAALVVMR